MQNTHTEQSTLLLIATEGEWAGRSLESELTDRGYAVLRTQSGKSALNLAHRTKPDAVILDQHLPEISGVDVCRQLRDDPLFDPATPVIVIASSPASHQERAAAYAAGAWMFIAQPIDTDLLVAQIATFVRARRAVVAAREISLVDPQSGLLNPLGLERWAEQLSARAVRKREPLACVVLMADPEAVAAGEDATEAVNAFIEASRAFIRQSDVVGRTPDGRLAVLAPDTDAAGVRGMIDRLRSAIESAPEQHPAHRTSAGFRAGYYTLDEFDTAAPGPAELLLRANKALEHASLNPERGLALDFRQLPLN